MPKKKATMTPAEQSNLFRARVREMIAAGELNPTEADEAFGRLVGSAAPPKVKNPR